MRTRDASTKGPRTVLGKILFLLTPREKRRGAIVLAMVITMAALETAGVASIMPFLSVLGNPEVVETNPFLAEAYVRLGFDSVEAFLVALGVGAFALILLSALFRTLTHYAMNRFVEMRRHAIGERLLETYLRQPYSYFLDRHSSDMAKSILSEVDQLVFTVFRPGMQMLAHGVVLFAVVILLLAMDPKLAVSVALVLGGTYGCIYVTVRGVLGRVGKDRAQANQERFEAASEALSGIKDIKLLGREQAYLTRFRGPSVRQAKHHATNTTLAQVPKYVMEAVAIGGILGLTLILAATQDGSTSDGLGSVLPVIGLYAFAGYRMLPAAQQIYIGVSKLRFGAPVIDHVYKDLEARGNLAEIRPDRIEPLRPKDSIRLVELQYTYPGADRPALSDIDLAIPVGSSVGLVGTTGAGKTTLVDLLLGLLRPTAGAITVDGIPVTDANLRAWQRSLGYVPQDIFLADTTIVGNIAFGIPDEHVDQDRVVHCAQMAQVHDFVTEELPAEYGTVVGERGVRLSGGQRQRIGIARALYHDPSVLVFDEATSALDSVTEQAVITAIEGLQQEKTIILIAHRLSTVRSCDHICLLEHGRIAGQGTYSDLLATNDRFRRIARGGTVEVQGI